MSKECVSEDEHLNRYPDGKAYGCENVFANTTHEVSYCVCDQDFCNGRSLNEQVQQQQPAVQQGVPGLSIFSDGSVINIPVGAPAGSEGIQIQPQPPQPQSPPLAQDQGLLLPAPPPLTPQLPVNVNEFGRTPPGAQINPVLPTNGQNIENANPAILIPPLILPNNSLLLPPLATSSAQPFSNSINAPQPHPANGPVLGRNAEVPQAPIQQQDKRPSIEQNAPVAVNAGFAVHVQGEPNAPGARVGSATVQNESQNQLRPSLNWTTIEERGQKDESINEQQNQPGESPSRWPVLTVQSHLLAQTGANGTKNPNDRQQHQQPDDLTLSCVTCAETNLSAGSDCRKQIPIECSRQFSAESKIFCFTKDTLLPTGKSEKLKQQLLFIF